MVPPWSPARPLTRPPDPATHSATHWRASCAPLSADSDLPLAAVGTGLLMVLTLAPGSAVARGNVMTPGNFTGYGFDQCLAPEQWEMDRWLNHSPFLAVGIYISGDSRGCRSQPNLTPRWITSQLNQGGDCCLITLGRRRRARRTSRGTTTTRRYQPDPAPNNGYPDARVQGRAEGRKTVRAATALGISRGEARCGTTSKASTTPRRRSPVGTPASSAPG